MLQNACQNEDATNVAVTSFSKKTIFNLSLKSATKSWRKANRVTRLASLHTKDQREITNAQCMSLIYINIRWHCCDRSITNFLIYNVTIRCMGIMDKTTTSGCDEGHEFCESCIRRHFNSGKTICPVCRQPGLSVNTMHRSKATDRRINNLEVKCKLSLNTEPREEKGPSSQKEEKEEIIDCDWTGPLSNLSDHMNHHCPLFPMECPDCDFQCLRHEMDQHNAECPEKKVECELGCS